MSEMHIPPDEIDNRLDAVGREISELEDLANEVIHGEAQIFKNSRTLACWEIISDSQT